MLFLDKREILLGLYRGTIFSFWPFRNVFTVCGINGRTIFNRNIVQNLAQYSMFPHLRLTRKKMYISHSVSILFYNKYFRTLSVRLKGSLKSILRGNTRTLKKNTKSTYISGKAIPFLLKFCNAVISLSFDDI